MTLRIHGDANDYFGKGLSGGMLKHLLNRMIPRLSEM
ncbi:Ferredoxin-dependent glutamate synthase 1 [Listeria monocytogenes]|nr:Ferredoxin-dependent glutamate synthase 1 [Listeria monocytogenes]